MNIKKHVITLLATGSLMLYGFAPLAWADTTLQTTGNGAGSTNTVTASSNNSSTLVQNNSANVTNTVTSNSNTGNNTSDENTGGNVTVDTGNAMSTTTIQNRLNANVANMGSVGCNCNNANTSVTVDGNGADSQNRTNVQNSNTTSAFQTNTADVTNTVSNNDQTGNNTANRNTGGDVLVLTGHALSNTTINTAANANVADFSGGSSNGGGSSDVLIKGNGFGSSNNVDLTSNNSATVVQDNLANIRNLVNSDLNTGRNQANENTGGNTTVDTGDAMSNVGLSTNANFNSADLASCGCATGVFEKIAGNGADSENSSNAHMTDMMSVFQGADGGNNAQITNDVTTNHNTGDNYANRNTGAVTGDPLNLISGFAKDTTQVATSANANVFGPNALQLPGGTNLNFTFDLNGLLGGMGF